MLVTAHIRSAEFLDVAASVLHDLVFDVEEVAQEGTTLAIPVYDDEPREAPRGRWWSLRRPPRPPWRDRVWRKGGLLINDVRSWHIHESEGIGIYPINTLRYDAQARRLTVVPVIPVDLWADVASLDIEVWLDTISRDRVT